MTYNRFIKLEIFQNLLIIRYDKNKNIQSMMLSLGVLHPKQPSGLYDK